VICAFVKRLEKKGGGRSFSGILNAEYFNATVQCGLLHRSICYFEERAYDPRNLCITF
jgi:hypothetical protein